MLMMKILNRKFFQYLMLIGILIFSISQYMIMSHTYDMVRHIDGPSGGYSIRWTEEVNLPSFFHPLRYFSLAIAIIGFLFIKSDIFATNMLPR